MSKIVFVQFLRSEETFEFEIGIDKTVGELKAKIEKFFHIKLQNKLKIKHNACRSLNVLEDENKNIKDARIKNNDIIIITKSDLCDC